MQDLIDYIIKSLVSKPEAVRLTQGKDEVGLVFNLTVDPSDMGMIIGRNGQTIRAIRKLLVVRAMAENPSLRVHLNLADA